MKKILILTANPQNIDQRRLDEEVREIQAGLERSKRRDQFELVSRWAVRPDDLRRALLDYEPQIVHFSGHGAGADGLALENNAEQVQLVSAQSLAKLFKLFKTKVECVLLNACYSEVQAEAIYQHINCVIGMNQAIGNQAAIEFAVGFYDALGAGRSFDDAFEFGCTAIDLYGIPESATPVLKSRPSIPQPQSPVARFSSRDAARSRIFISYKRGVEPDEPIALELYRVLSQQHEVFIDQTMPVGTRWAERIEAEIRQSNFLIALLSAQSVHSEMLQGEIETAHRVGSEQGSNPAILPVRLAYRQPFVYPLSDYLNPINWAFWSGPADTPHLLEELRQAIAGGDLLIGSEQAKADLIQPAAPQAIPQPLPSAQPSRDARRTVANLEMPEGTMDPDSQFYVVRSADAIALDTIQRRGVTITIKGPRQMGKSSLLMRTIDAALQAEKRVAFLDFQLFDQEALTQADTFYRQFCTIVSDQLGLSDRVDEYWQSGVGNNQRCTRYMQSYVLKELGSPLLLAMDEVDRMFDSEFRSDFFSMLRSWHNNRALPTMRIWKQFDLTLVTATEPYHLIANLNQSPFNVGEVILLTDFTVDQVSELNQRHGSPLTPAQERQLMGLLHGHPYLIRKALYLVTSGQMAMEALLAQATDDRGPFGDHLRYHLFRIYPNPELVQGLLQVIRSNTCPDERISRLLVAAGLIQRDGQTALPRCQLYADYFRERLHG